MPRLSQPSLPTRVTIFNHKGGVGKTTLCINTAFALAEQGKKVLLVDSDPQCNLTSYLLADDVVDHLLDKSDSASGQTIWTAVKPIFDNIGVGTLVKPKKIGNLQLIPGDIRLSEFEEFLAEAWTDSFKRRLGGLRATSSISNLVSQISLSEQIDYVFYDTGPNIGALNRVLLLDSHFFIVPVACDLFSMRALSTLGQTLKKWILDAQTIESLAPNGSLVLPGHPRFLGYIPQRFRIYGQEMANEPATYLRQIKRKMNDNIGEVLRQIDENLAEPKTVDPVVGKIQDFSTLVQSAQREGVSLWRCTVPGSYAEMQRKAKDAFAEIAKRIIQNSTSARRDR